jgi:hypothetical protein
MSPDTWQPTTPAYKMGMGLARTLVTNQGKTESNIRLKSPEFDEFNP